MTTYHVCTYEVTYHHLQYHALLVRRHSDKRPSSRQLVGALPALRVPTAAETSGRKSSMDQRFQFQG